MSEAASRTEPGMPESTVNPTNNSASNPTEEGFEFYLFEGVKRYQCPCCRYNTQDLEVIRKHVRGLHREHWMKSASALANTPASPPRDSDIPPPTEHGYEYFFWPDENGQKRYRCPKTWESGEKCRFDTYSLEMMAEHVCKPHTRDGKPAVRRATVSPILDSEGNQIIREYKEPDLPPEYNSIRFKK